MYIQLVHVHALVQAVLSVLSVLYCTAVRARIAVSSYLLASGTFIRETT